MRDQQSQAKDMDKNKYKKCTSKYRQEQIALLFHPNIDVFQFSCKADMEIVNILYLLVLPCNLPTRDGSREEKYGRWRGED